MDRNALIKGIMYLIRDILYYGEIVEIKDFCKEIIKEKENSGYTE